MCITALQGFVFLNQYLVVKDLGRGTHGVVKLVLSTQDDMLYAVKARCPALPCAVLHCPWHA